MACLAVYTRYTAADRYPHQVIRLQEGSVDLPDSAAPHYTVLTAPLCIMNFSALYLFFLLTESPYFPCFVYTGSDLVER